MPASDTLKKFRSQSYGDGPPDSGAPPAPGAPPETDDSPAGPRTIKLTDDEAKEIQGYSPGPGHEQECLVTGRLGEDGEFTVTSVHAPSGPPPSDAKAVATGNVGGPPLAPPMMGAG